MVRHVPILFIVLMIISAAAGAHAEPGFFEQLLGSLKSAAPQKNELAAESTPINESEPLALQPTETATPRLSGRKRYHSRRHHRQAPAMEKSPMRVDPPTASQQRPTEPLTQDSSVPRELTDNAKLTEQVPPSTDVDNVLPPAGTWPNLAPQALLPWPVEDARAEAALAGPAPAAQTEPARDQQAEPQTAMTSEGWQISMSDADEIEPDSFLDSQRLMLGFIAAAWLTLGLLTFAFRRYLARAIDALRRRRQQFGIDTSQLDARRQPLTLILKNASNGGRVREKVGDVRVQALPVG